MNDKKLIHMGRINSSSPQPFYLSLREIASYHYIWYQISSQSEETETTVWGPTVEEAIRLAHRYWKLNNFRTLHCGFLYTLPERDEHGSNALFHQMLASYLSPHGIFFNEEMGCNCFVQNASLEARKLMKNYL